MKLYDMRYTYTGSPNRIRMISTAYHALDDISNKSIERWQSVDALLSYMCQQATIWYMDAAGRQMLERQWPSFSAKTS